MPTATSPLPDPRFPAPVGPASGRLARRTELEAMVAAIRSSKTGVCTQLARRDQARFGGQVYGYYLRDNPGARDLCEEGHDFLVTEDGFIVDRWLRDVWAEAAVYDLHAAGDQAKIREIYGDVGCWTLVPATRSSLETSAPVGA